MYLKLLFGGGGEKNEFFKKARALQAPPDRLCLYRNIPYIRVFFSE